jgi:hypothetical protein
MHIRHLHTTFVRTAAAAAILLSTGVSVAHAAPGDGTGGSDDTDQPPTHVSVAPPIDTHASENPVWFAPNQSTKTIQVLWNSQPDSEVSVAIYRDVNHYMWTKYFDPGTGGSVNLTVEYGHNYRAWVCRKVYDWCPLYAIVTKRKELADPTLIPLPVPHPETGRKPQLENTPDAPQRVPQNSQERRAPSADTESPVR